MNRSRKEALERPCSTHNSHDEHNQVHSGKLTWLGAKWTWIEDVWTLLKMGIFQPAMLVYQRVLVTCTVQRFPRGHCRLSPSTFNAATGTVVKP